MSTEMRIVFVSYMDFSGPGVIHMFHFANGLVNKGHRVLFLLNGKKKTVSGMSEKPLFDIEEIRFQNGKLPQAFLRRVERFKPDLIHLWTPRNTPAKVGLELKAKHDVPLIIHYEDDEDILFEQAEHNLFQKLSFTENSFYYPEKWVWIHPYTYFWINTYASYLTSISLAYARVLEEKWTIPVSLLIPGVDLDRFSPNCGKNNALINKLGLDGKQVLIYGGSVVKFYEFQILLEAFAKISDRFPNLVVMQYGRNFMQGEVDTFLNEHDLHSRVQMIGQIHHHVVEKYLSLGDILVQPGQNTPFNLHRLPSKVPEYMAMGKPVIIFACGIGESFEHKKHAYKLTVGSSDELAGAISEILTDNHLSASLAEGSRKKAEEIFSWDRSVDNLVSIYQTVLARQFDQKSKLSLPDDVSLQKTVLSDIDDKAVRDSVDLWKELTDLRKFQQKVRSTLFYKIYSLTKRFYIYLFQGRKKG